MYLDSIGLLASLANRLLLNQSMPTAAQIKTWDSVLVPCSRVLDPFLFGAVGKSVLGIWRNVYGAAQRAIPLAVFIATLSLLWWIFGNRLILGTNDEGIYLDAAERILHGQKPYVDFFGYMSPGSFWMQALAFRFLGVTLAAGRALVILYVALECG